MRQDARSLLSLLTLVWMLSAIGSAQVTKLNRPFAGDSVFRAEFSSQDFQPFSVVEEALDGLGLRILGEESHPMLVVVSANLTMFDWAAANQPEEGTGTSNSSSSMMEGTRSK